MIYDVVHRTSYRYDAPVTLSVGEAHLLPGDLDGQRCLAGELEVTPEPAHRRERLDLYGNRVAHFSVREPHTELHITATSTIDTSQRPERIGSAAERPWESLVVDGTSTLDVVELSVDSPLIRRSTDLASYASRSLGPGVSIGEAIADLSRRVNTDFTFDPKATDVDTPLAEVMARRRGVCQDFAHVLIGCLRSVGLAAGYVSGYLETDPPPGRPRLVGADRTHAWVDVHVGDGVWIGIDPTNDQLAGRRYLTTAHGRDYRDVPPLKGVIFTEAEESELTVSVDVVAR
ncbi:MAG: transglutaminase family protein [Actinomycetota bacterium]